MSRTSQGPQEWRDIALRWALGIEAVGLLVGFALAEPTTLRPDHSGSMPAMGALLVAGCVSFAALVVAAIRQHFGAAWWAAASMTASLAVLVMLMESGTGGWFIGCAAALLAIPAGVVASLPRASRPAPEGDPDPGAAPGDGTGKAATALAAVALAASLFMGGGMEDVDFSGTWTADRHDLTLTLTGEPDGGGQYTLELGGCSERSSWVLDHPQMTTSVRVLLLRDESSTCLPGTRNLVLHVTGGTVVTPTLDFQSPDGTRRTLRRG
ncbi:hypothetical protein ABZ605_21625 [Streptomyces sp. NPDC012765]|uniref:hypothetical protein n=1 Tax=Streptomyces sp. NPDC012765 TaxID=3155249 RepID=UPI0033C32100